MFEEISFKIKITIKIFNKIEKLFILEFIIKNN